MELLDLIERISLFNSFSPQEKRKMAEFEHTFLRYEPGEFIVRQLTHESSFFILIRGQVVVTRNAQPERPIATMNAGAIFGEMAFLTGEQRSSNVIAASPCVVMKINEMTFQRMDATMREKLKDRLIEVLVERIDKLTTKLLVARDKSSGSADSGDYS
ncbi:MAG: cyclic nucleotide-binding domain-containing protein [Magnetococcus sp. WYHC-3]